MTKLNGKNTEDKQNRSETGVDTGLVVMFLEMTPEERLRSNDNAVNMITEMRNAFREKQISNCRSGRSA